MARKEVTAQGGYGSYRIREGEADWAWADAAFADGVRYRFGDLPEIAHPEDLEITTSSTWNLNLVTVREQIRAGVYQVLLLQQPYGAIAQSFGWGTEFKVSGPQVLHNAYEFWISLENFITTRPHIPCTTTSILMKIWPPVRSLLPWSKGW